MITMCGISAAAMVGGFFWGSQAKVDWRRVRAKSGSSRLTSTPDKGLVEVIPDKGRRSCRETFLAQPSPHLPKILGIFGVN